MVKPKLTLNMSAQTRSPTDRVKDAAKRKQDAIETIEDAWARILVMKNSDADQRRLHEVKRAMEGGLIGREPPPKDKRQGKFSKAEALRLWRVLDDKRQADRLKRMVDEMPSNYLLITDKADLSMFLKLVDVEDEIVFDVETTGTDVWSDYIVGHVISAVKADVHAYIPTKHDDPLPQLDNDYVNEKLRPYYEDESLGKIAHNASFDIHMLDREGITLRGLTWDTQEAMKLLNENEQTYALKPLVSKYLNDPSSTYSELFGKRGFNEIPLDQAVAYAAKDGDVTLRLRDFQRHHLANTPGVLEYYKTVEVPLIPIIVEMEKEGYEIDLEFAQQYGDQLRKESEEYGKRVFAVLGDINLNSPIQLKAAIERHIGKSIENTDANKTLKPLAKEFPIIDDLLKYRETNKLLSTYVDNMPNMIREKTGRLHANFNPNGAKTGRFSSNNPNLQNQSSDSKKLFVAPDGYYIVNADFAAQEVRMIASVSGEDVLLDAFAEGRDPYATLGARYYGLPYEDCYKEADGRDTRVRLEMKVVLLQSLYGASKYGIAERLGITLNEAEKFRIDFFKTYRKIDSFIQETQAFANRYGYVWIGDKQRKRRLPDAKGNMRRYDPKRNRAMRQGPNARIQGLAAIQTKVTMIKLAEECKRRGWRLWGAIHDELLVLMPTTATRVDFDKLDEIMTQSFLVDGVDNGTDIEVQRRWGNSITAEEFLRGVPVPEADIKLR